MSKEINLDSLITKTENFVSSELDDSLVMMSLETNSYYGLDEIGRRFLELAEKPVRITEIVKTMLEEYEVSPEKCEEDIIALAKSLLKEGIICLA